MDGEKAIRWRAGDEVLRFSPGEVTPQLERELWQAAKVTPMDAMQALAGGAVFGLAAITWLARRQAGVRQQYATVEAEVAKAAREPGFEVEMLDDDVEGGDDGPPA